MNADISRGEQWTNEKFQRNCITRGLDKIGLNDNDLVIISDVDEIPDPKTIKTLNVINAIQLEQDFYYYNIETKMDHLWYFSKIVNYGWFKNSGLTCNDIRNKSWYTIKKGGWHLSYFGTPSFIKNKIENFSHQEYNKNNFTSIENIERRLAEGLDIYDRNVKLIKIPVTENGYLPPGYIKNI